MLHVVRVLFSLRAQHVARKRLHPTERFFSLQRRVLGFQRGTGRLSSPSASESQKNRPPRVRVRARVLDKGDGGVVRAAFFYFNFFSKKSYYLTKFSTYAILFFEQEKCENLNLAQKGQMEITKYHIKIAKLIKKLRRKYVDNPRANSQLDRVLWYSYSAMYGCPFSANEVELRRFIEAERKRRHRARKYLMDMHLCYDCNLTFLTFTRSPEHESTSSAWFHRTVKAFLEEYCYDYYANQDFGDKNHREHYHAVVCFMPQFRGREKEEFLKEAWKYGFLGFETIRKYKTDIRKIASYVSKLSNHSVKLTCGKVFHKTGMKVVDNLPF